MDETEDDIGIFKAAPNLLSRLQADFTKLIVLPAESIIDNEVDKFISLLNPFQESPQLIDPILESFVSQLTCKYLDSSSKNVLCDWLFRVLYTLCKVRGAKTVTQFFPSEVRLLEHILEEIESNEVKVMMWEKRYVLLLWLSILILAPFSLSTFGDDFSKRLYKDVTPFLQSPGKDRDAAAIVIARLISRHDVEDSVLPNFFTKHVHTVWTLSDQKSTSNFQKIGTLQTTASALQIIDRKKLHDDRQILIAFYDLIVEEFDATQGGSALLHKLYIKNIGRICLSFLTVENAYIEQVETIIGKILEGLGNKDTNVRYTSSKALARIVSKLPSREFQQEVIGVILEVFDEDILIDPKNQRSVEQVSSYKWHGTLLCLAEFLQRRLIDPEKHFEKLMEILNEALKFRQKRLTFAMGTNVRDASCYVCWALFRSYKNLDLVYADKLINELVCLSCFDREVNIRRAASAAIQEGIGRQYGTRDQKRMEKGIALIQAVDYFKIGLRTNSFLEVPKVLLDLGGYRDLLWTYVIDRPLSSWDVEVRRLAARALVIVSSGKADEEIISRLFEEYKLLPKFCDADVKHGILYGIGEMVDKSVSKQKYAEQVLDILKRYNELELTQENEVLNCDTFLHLFRTVVDNPAEPIIKLSDKLSLTLNLVDEIIVAEVLEVLTRATKVSSGFTASLPFDTWIERMKTGKGSYARALGSITNPPRRIVGALKVSINSRDKRKPEFVDASTRSKAIDSLALLLQRELWKKNVDRVSDTLGSYRAILLALGDYSVDHRGDVGSWSRESALKAFINLNNSWCYDRFEELRTHMISDLLRISLEPLDKLRRLAVQGVAKIFSEDCEHIMLVSHLKDNILSKDLLTSDYFYQLLIPTKFNVRYRLPILQGLVCTGGAQQGSEEAIRGAVDGYLKFDFESEDDVVKLRYEIVGLIDKKYGPRVSIGALRFVATIIDKLDTDSKLNNKIYETVRNFLGAANPNSPMRLAPSIRVFGHLAWKYRHFPSIQALTYLCCNCSSPTVRSSSVEQLYTCLLEYEDSVDEDVMEKFASVDWDLPVGDEERKILDSVLKQFS